MSISPAEKPVNLTRYAWLSIAAAVLTIAIKLGAYFLTNSVGLLSDALESVVNLAAALVALAALNIAARPADEEFSFGYSKIEFFASGFEGGMILLAAVAIAISAIPRLLDPQPIEQVGLGLIVSVIASLINLGVALVLNKAGKRYHSITLEADSRHLMTDVWTTAGVLVGVGLVSLTGWYILDPILALLVAANIVFTGVKLVRRSVYGLLDTSLPDNQLKIVTDILDTYQGQGVQFHAVRSRIAGALNFISMHVLVPGEWTLQQSHNLAEELEHKLESKIPGLIVFTHLEPLEDPASWSDTSLVFSYKPDSRPTSQTQPPS